MQESVSKNGKIKVLVVDDINDDRERMEYLLHRFNNIEISNSVNTSQSAFDIIKKTLPDIAFLDIEVDHNSGFEIADKIREEGLSTRIVFVTGHSQYCQKAIRVQAFDYLLKPVDIDELKDCIFRYSQLNIRKTRKKTCDIYFTEQELEVLNLLFDGLDSKEIAKQLNKSHHTINEYRKKLLEKTGVNNSVSLIRFALENNILKF